MKTIDKAEKQRGFLQAFPGKRSLLAPGIIVLGVVLGFAVHRGFLTLVAAGFFGPPLLRALGIIHDLDEFQRQASQKAGLHGYIAGGVTIVFIMCVQWFDVVETPEGLDLWFFVLAVMVVVYYISYLMQFWDGKKAAFRILLVFSVFWFIFVILSEWGNWTAFTLELLAVPAPLAAAAFLSSRWPLLTGVLLCALAVGMILFFNLLRVFSGNIGSLFTFFLLPVPEIIAAIALIREKTHAIHS